MRRKAFIIFFSVVFVVLTIMNGYLFHKGWPAVPAGSAKTIYTALFMLVSFAFPIGRFLERRFPGRLATLFVWVGGFYFAALTYLLISFLLLDVLRAFDYYLPFLPYPLHMRGTAAARLTVLLLTGAVAVTVLLGWYNAANPRVRRLSIQVNKSIPGVSSLTLAVASDIHLGTIISTKRVRHIVKLLNSINADLVLLPGDVFDEDLGPVIKENLGEEFRGLRARYGKYAVTGNHEYIGGANPAVEYLTEHGITVLRDETATPLPGVSIIGREDVSANSFGGGKRKPLAELLAGVPFTNFRILLDHQPYRLEQAVENNIDVQLSGHTHHGQLWPFNFITKKIYEVSWGYKLKGATHIYVSCGAGTWGPPVRTGNRPEVIALTVNFTG